MVSLYPPPRVLTFVKRRSLVNHLNNTGVNDGAYTSMRRLPTMQHTLRRNNMTDIVDGMMAGTTIPYQCRAFICQLAALLQSYACLTLFAPASVYAYHIMCTYTRRCAKPNTYLTNWHAAA